MGGLFKSKPKAPVIKPPAPLPDEDLLRRSKRKDLAAQKSRTGRSSTILSESEDRLGG